MTRSDGAIYLWAKLPDGMDDAEVVETLVKEHKVCIIPGSSCGSPGFVRVAFANLTEEACEEAWGALVDRGAPRREGWLACRASSGGRCAPRGVLA